MEYESENSSSDEEYKEEEEPRLVVRSAKIARHKYATPKYKCFTAGTTNIDMRGGRLRYPPGYESYTKFLKDHPYETPMLLHHEREQIADDLYVEHLRKTPVLVNPYYQIQEWQNKYGISIQDALLGVPVMPDPNQEAPMYEDHKKYHAPWVYNPYFWDAYLITEDAPLMGPLKAEDFPLDDEETESVDSFWGSPSQSSEHETGAPYQTSPKLPQKAPPGLKSPISLRNSPLISHNKPRRASLHASSSASGDGSYFATSGTPPSVYHVRPSQTSSTGSHYTPKGTPPSVRNVVYSHTPPTIVHRSPQVILPYVRPVSVDESYYTTAGTPPSGYHGRPSLASPTSSHYTSNTIPPSMVNTVYYYASPTIVHSTPPIISPNVSLASECESYYTTVETPPTVNHGRRSQISPSQNHYTPKGTPPSVRNIVYSQTSPTIVHQQILAQSDIDITTTKASTKGASYHTREDTTEVCQPCKRITKYTAKPNYQQPPKQTSGVCAAIPAASKQHLAKIPKGNVCKPINASRLPIPTYKRPEKGDSKPTDATVKPGTDAKVSTRRLEKPTRPAYTKQEGITSKRGGGVSKIPKYVGKPTDIQTGVTCKTKVVPSTRISPVKKPFETRSVTHVRIPKPLAGSEPTKTTLKPKTQSRLPPCQSQKRNLRQGVSDALVSKTTVKRLVKTKREPQATEGGSYQPRPKYQRSHEVLPVGRSENVKKINYSRKESKYGGTASKLSKDTNQPLEKPARLQPYKPAAPIRKPLAYASKQTKLMNRRQDETKGLPPSHSVCPISKPVTKVSKLPKQPSQYPDKSKTQTCSKPTGTDRTRKCKVKPTTSKPPWRNR